MTKRNKLCLCCNNLSKKYQWALLSSFLSYRAFHTSPEPVRIFECTSCGFRWCERGLTDIEAERLYSGYRTDEYFHQRYSFEPWYSRSINNRLGSEESIIKRRDSMMSILKQCGINIDSIKTVVDHGGDRGQMLLGFKNATKKVHDLSGVALEFGCERIITIQDEIERNDIVLNCHVLEHLNSPQLGLKESVSLIKQYGFVYVEVPYEVWKNPYQFANQRKIILNLTKHKTVLKYIDFFYTGMKSKFHLLPPLGFVFTREHLQFFTITALNNLMKKCGLHVIFSQKLNGNLVALGRKY